MNMKTKEHKIVPTHNGLMELKATAGDSKKRAKAIQAISQFVEELDKLKGTPFAVRCGVIHGAFARGARRFQQVDTLLVLEKNADEVDAFDFVIDNIFCDIYLDTGIYFYIAVMNPATLQSAIAQPSPLFRRIQKEGIVFYGQDILHQESESV